MRIVQSYQHRPAPYRGAVLTDVISGRVTMTLMNMGAILPLVRDGKLRGLDVTSLKRSPIISELPTLAESGFPDFEAISWLKPSGMDSMADTVNARLY
jgi:tripartite-type tricarboxylate transporter receptor subunit TctC